MIIGVRYSENQPDHRMFADSQGKNADKSAK